MLLLTIAACAPSPNTNTALIPVPQLEEDGYDWYARHEAIKRLGREIDPEIILIGDSITHYWGGEPRAQRIRGPEAWDAVFGDYRTINMGYGWDRIQNALWRVQQGEIDEIAPAYIIVNIGTNNLSRSANARENTPQEIAEGIRELCSRIQAKHENADIILMGVFPRNRDANHPDRDKIRQVNELIASLGEQDKIHYLDIGEHFLDDNGDIRRELMTDFLHPSPEGYTIWAQALKEKIAQLEAKGRKQQLSFPPKDIGGAAVRARDGPA